MSFFPTFPNNIQSFVRSRSRFFVFIVAITAISLSVLIFLNKSQMSVDWTYPYFSGAANFEKLFDWQISPSDYEFASRLSLNEYLAYRHHKTAETINYGLNSYGYVLIALLSRHLFFFLGDIQGVICLQLLFHLLISFFFLLYVFRDLNSRLLFIFLYIANPLVIYFVTFPFYYFWLCVPSACFSVLLLQPSWTSMTVPVSTPLLLISLLIRPTSALLCLLFYAVSFFITGKKRISILAPSLAIFVAGALFFASVNPRFPPWHTMYIGLGAYSNNFDVPTLSDEEGYRYFHGQTGIPVSTDPIHGNWGQPAFMKSYNYFLRRRYSEIVTHNPFVFLKNAALNLGQVFSLGYIVGRPALSLLSSFAGWAILVYLLIRKQWIWVLAVFSSSFSFFWYFPPIPAYNFGAYLLLSCGFISSLPNSRGDREDVARFQG